MTDKEGIAHKLGRALGLPGNCTRATIEIDFGMPHVVMVHVSTIVVDSGFEVIKKVKPYMLVPIDSTNEAG